MLACGMIGEKYKADGYQKLCPGNNLRREQLEKCGYMLSELTAFG